MPFCYGGLLWVLGHAVPALLTRRYPDWGDLRVVVKRPEAAADLGHLFVDMARQLIFQRSSKACLSLRRLSLRPLIAAMKGTALSFKRFSYFNFRNLVSLMLTCSCCNL